MRRRFEREIDEERVAYDYDRQWEFGYADGQADGYEGRPRADLIDMHLGYKDGYEEGFKSGVAYRRGDAKSRKRGVVKGAFDSAAVNQALEQYLNVDDTISDLSFTLSGMDIDDDSFDESHSQEFIDAVYKVLDAVEAADKAEDKAIDAIETLYRMNSQGGRDG